MEEIVGVLKEMGDSVSQTKAGFTFFNVYSYISIGDRLLKKVMVTSGLNGKLHNAVSSGEQVTLFKKYNFIVGIKFADGETFGSEMVSLNIFLCWFIIICTLFFGVLLCLTIIGAVLGLPMLYITRQAFKTVSAKSAAASLPNVIII